MKAEDRLFDLVTDEEWKEAGGRIVLHADVVQILEFLKTHPLHQVKLKTPHNPGKKRALILEYARRRGMKLDTMIPRNGYIYIRLMREGEPRSGRFGHKAVDAPEKSPRTVSMRIPPTTAAEWRELKKKERMP